MAELDTFKMLKLMFDWRVILDILLIATTLFFLYRALHRLGAWKIVAGIFLAIAYLSWGHHGILFDIC